METKKEAARSGATLQDIKKVYHTSEIDVVNALLSCGWRLIDTFKKREVLYYALGSVLPMT